MLVLMLMWLDSATVLLRELQTDRSVQPTTYVYTYSSVLCNNYLSGLYRT